MVQLKGLDPDLAIAYEELSKDMLLLPEWDWQRRLSGERNWSEKKTAQETGCVEEMFWTKGGKVRPAHQ